MSGKPLNGTRVLVIDEAQGHRPFYEFALGQAGGDVTFVIAEPGAAVDWRNARADVVIVGIGDRHACPPGFDLIAEIECDRTKLGSGPRVCVVCTYRSQHLRQRLAELGAHNVNQIDDVFYDATMLVGMVTSALMR